MQSNNFLYIVVILESLDGVRVGEGGLLEHPRTAGPSIHVVLQLEHLVAPAVEKVVGANTLLSGLGAAHSLHNGLTALEGTHHYRNEEKVAFGAIATIMQEERPAEILSEVVDFCLEVSLPVTPKKSPRPRALRARPCTTCPLRSTRRWSSTPCTPPTPTVPSVGPCRPAKRRCRRGSVVRILGGSGPYLLSAIG